MKIMDRYVLGTFLKNYVISLAVLIGLFVVMDMVFKFDDIVAPVQATGQRGITGVIAIIKDVADYYFFQSFLIFVQLSGIIPIVAAAFTLLRFSRFSELTAFLAAGVPLLRTALWIIYASIALNVLVVVDQEYVLPTMITKLTRKVDELHAASDQWFRISSMQVGDRSLLLATRYHPPLQDAPAYMEEMDLIERNDLMQPISHTFAERATWNPVHERWDLTNGKRVDQLLQPEHHTDELPVEFLKNEVTPAEVALYHNSSFVELLSTRRINELIARPKSYGVNHLYRVKHLRFTQPMMNVILLLLAIPSVLTHDPKSLKRAASKCLMLTGLAMGCVFLTQQFANNPPLGAMWQNGWPMLMAWLPVLIFGPLAAWLLARLPT